MTLLAGAVLALSAPVWAAEKAAEPAPKAPNAAATRPARPQGQDRVARLTEQLKLTPEQQTKVEALFKDERDKAKDLRDQSQSLPQEERRAKMREMREGMDTKMKGILTPDQYEKWKAMRQQGQRPGGQGGAQPKPQPKPEPKAEK
jgi:Spy/CpxP family protein refolding chaperone